MPHLCSLCATDDSTTEHRTDDGIRYVVCTDRSHGSDGYVWDVPPPPGRSMRGDGLGAELGIWDKLLELCVDHEDYLPYGDVEDRLFDRHPAEARTLLHRYGHKFRDSEHPSGRYSMSAYLASRLKELEKEGHLDLRFLPASGPWAHNGVISHWRLARPG